MGRRWRLARERVSDATTSSESTASLSITYNYTKDTYNETKETYKLTKETERESFIRNLNGVRHQRLERMCSL